MSIKLSYSELAQLERKEQEHLAALRAPREKYPVGGFDDILDAINFIMAHGVSRAGLDFLNSVQSRPIREPSDEDIASLEWFIDRARYREETGLRERGAGYLPPDTPQTKGKRRKTAKTKKISVTSAKLSKIDDKKLSCGLIIALPVGEDLIKSGEFDAIEFLRSQGHEPSPRDTILVIKLQAPNNMYMPR